MSTTLRKARCAKRRRKRDGLLRYASDVTSQNGEDGILARIFELLPPASNRWCVDVGAWDGRHWSNTYSLLVGQPQRWRGVLFEANPERFSQLEATHAPLGNVCVCEAVSCERGSPLSLPAMLRSHAPSLPPDFDLVSIDVDGPDYHLFADLLASGFVPKVVVVEFNPSVPDDVVFIQPQNDGVRQGSSLAALYELAEDKGYRLVETTLFNAFFVREDLYSAHLCDEVPDTSLDALHEVSMGTQLFQLYDGTLKIFGCKKLLWHRIRIREEDVQVLPRDRRAFPFSPPPPPTSAVENGAVAE